MADSDGHLTLPLLEGDWPTQAADTIEQVVGTVRDRAIAPILTAARVVVYALVGGTLILAAVIWLIIGVVRLLNNYIPGDVWVVYLGLGGLFVIAGLILWTRRGTATLPDAVPTPAIAPASTS